LETGAAGPVAEQQPGYGQIGQHDDDLDRQEIGIDDAQWWPLGNEMESGKYRNVRCGNGILIDRWEQGDQQQVGNADGQRNALISVHGRKLFCSLIIFTIPDSSTGSHV